MLTCARDSSEPHIMRGADEGGTEQGEPTDSPTTTKGVDAPK
ncbi:MAG: hypothetical protein AAGJ93_13500 [Bacteroidota bacterium]